MHTLQNETDNSTEIRMKVCGRAEEGKMNFGGSVCPEYSSEGLMLKLQYHGHVMQRANSLERTLMLARIEGKRRRGRQRMSRLDSITDSVDMNLSKFWEIVEDRGACCSSVVSDPV